MTQECKNNHPDRPCNRLHRRCPGISQAHMYHSPMPQKEAGEILLHSFGKMTYLQKAGKSRYRMADTPLMNSPQCCCDTCRLHTNYKHYFPSPLGMHLQDNRDKTETCVGLDICPPGTLRIARSPTSSLLDNPHTSQLHLELPQVGNTLFALAR